MSLMASPQDLQLLYINLRLYVVKNAYKQFAHKVPAFIWVESKVKTHSAEMSQNLCLDLFF